MTVRLTRLQNVRKLRPGDESLAKAVEEAQAKVKSLTDNVADLARRVDIDEDAAVEVKGLVYPGVIVTICHIRVNVDEPLKKARFRLDRAANKIVIER